jgi:hypothetical protein
MSKPIRYATGRIVGDAVASASRGAFSIKTPGGLAKAWAAESRTLGGPSDRSRRAWGVDRLPRGHVWYSSAARFLEWCTVQERDPARVVAALFDYARICERRGKRWIPYIRASCTTLTARLHDDWEVRERRKADGQVRARIELASADARARRERYHDALTTPLPRSPIIRRAVARSVPDRVVNADAIRAAVLFDVQRILARAERARVEPWIIVDENPVACLPAVRHLFATALHDDADDPDVMFIVARPVFARELREALILLGALPSVDAH